MALNSLAYLVGCCLTIASPTLGWWPRWRVFAGSQTELPHLSLSPYGANFYGVYFSVVERVELSRLLRVVDPHNILHSGTICRDGLAGGAMAWDMREMVLLPGMLLQATPPSQHTPSDRACTPTPPSHTDSSSFSTKRLGLTWGQHASGHRVLPASNPRARAGRKPRGLFLQFPARGSQSPTRLEQWYPS